MIGRPNYSQNFLSNIYLFDYFINYVIIIPTLNVKSKRIVNFLNQFE